MRWTKISDKLLSKVNESEYKSHVDNELFFILQSMYNSIHSHIPIHVTTFSRFATTII